MGRKKGYKKSKKRSRKHRGRLYKQIKRGVKAVLYKYTDVKISLKRHSLNPQLANYPIPTGWIPIDPGLSSGSVVARNAETCAANLFGTAANAQPWVVQTNCPFIQGNTIKRIGFKIRLHWLANWYSGVGPIFTYVPSPPTVTNQLSAQAVETRMRITILRSQKGISDIDLEATYLLGISNTNFEDQWNPSRFMVLYDRFVRCSAPGSGAKNFSTHKTISFKGKRGSQRLNFSIADNNGALSVSYQGQGKLYLVIQILAYSYVNNLTQYQLLPFFDKIEFITKYIDI